MIWEVERALLRSSLPHGKEVDLIRLGTVSEGKSSQNKINLI